MIANLNRWQDLARRVLDGYVLSSEEALDILRSSDDELLTLLSAAYDIRRHYYGNTVKLNFLVNARSGICPEDCGYCSQSRVSDAQIPKYGLETKEEVLAQAERAIALRASTCCIVTSGRGPSDRDVDHITEAVREIKSKHPELRICACLGLLKEGQAERLQQSGVDRYNHNLNTAESHHDDIVTTHTYEDRTRTVEAAKSAGISPCSGVIVGLGESFEQLVESAFALRAIDADSIPVNFLIPIEGTPMSELGTELNPRQGLRTLALFRFVCPTKEIRLSAGREVHFRHLQPLALYAANAMFVADYLTEPGQDARLDWEIIEDLGFVVESLPSAQEAAATSSAPTT